MHSVFKDWVSRKLAGIFFFFFFKLCKNQIAESMWVFLKERFLNFYDILNGVFFSQSFLRDQTIFLGSLMKFFIDVCGILVSSN